MQTITRGILVVGVLACLVASAVQARADKKPKGTTCSIINGACVSVDCSGECGPVFPASCVCIR